MNEKLLAIVRKLAEEHQLETTEYEFLLENYSEELAVLLAEHAVRQRAEIYGKKVYIRGLIEISNYCKNNCRYCGIQSSNRACERYRLSNDEILDCCWEGYQLGFRTFVLQGGEDRYFTDDILCTLITDIKRQFPDCAITLSLGERSVESYQKLRHAGADRYLLRHETADEALYQKLHPASMSLKNRMECLHNLKVLGFQTGCGFMVGAPFQTLQSLAKDLKFAEEFRPHMCGIGPFVPHHATEFCKEPAGDVAFTCFLLSILRLIQPELLLPATTALGTLDDHGQEKGILAGANVIMPNLSPLSVRKHYQLYDKKAFTGTESAQCIQQLKQRMKHIGYSVVTDRGDAKSFLHSDTKGLHYDYI